MPSLFAAGSQRHLRDATLESKAVDSRALPAEKGARPLRWGVVMRNLAAAFMSLAIAAAPAAAQTPGSRAPGDGNAALSARLERLEQQIADLQGVVAAVETLAKNNSGSGGYAAAGGGASSEQVRQLSEQIAELTQRLERLEAGNAGGEGVRPPAGQSRQGSGYGASPATGFEDK